MVKTKKKEVQKQGLRPSQKVKAEKLLKKQAAKKAAADLLSVNENEAQSIVSATEAETQPSLSAAAEKKTRAKVAISLTKDKKIVRKAASAATAKKTMRTTAKKTTEEEQPQVKENEALATITVKNAEGDPDTVAEILIQNKIDYTPKVSVIIPVYNVEPYLRECLDSVINQTLKEIEIICVDDGSTDASLEILKEYAEKDNRITVITQKNLYAGVARNAGLSQAKGEYLSFLDSDDFFELNMLEETYAKINKEKTDVIMFNVYLFDDTLQEDKEVEWTLDIKEVPAVFNYNDVPEKIFKLSNCWVWNRLYKTEFVKENNIKFQKLGCANDTYFSCIATVLASSITYLDKRYVHYRMNRQQFQNVTSFSFRHRFPTDLLNCFYNIYLKLKQLGIYEMVKKSYLQVAVEHIIWSEKAFSDDETLHLTFVTYLAKNYKEILQGLPPFTSNALNKKYTYLRNLLVDYGVFKEIPRRVYYVWGANEPKREEVLKCMRSWEQFLPDYDIVEINDDSTKYFNFAHELETNSWFRTVYERKMWAYVADYIRMKTLYENGGVYFDTDVSVVKNMDEFLTNKAFVGIQSSSKDGSGDWCEPAICGAQKGNEFIGKIVSFYDNLIWKEPIYTMPHLFDYFLRNYDIFPFPVRNKQKIIKLPDITLYPERYFIPYRFREEYRPECIEEDTHTIHWWGSSWVKPHIQYFLQNKHLLSNPKITVIICVYNVEKYLRECLDSVINQTLKNIEIICVNDESPDNSLAILKEYAEKDNRIVIIDQKNQGLSGSRNNAMKIAHGRYLMFLDSDDYIDLNTMEKLYNYATDNYLDMVSFSGYNFIDGKNELLDNDYWNYGFLPKEFNCSSYNYNDCIDFISKMPVSSCLTMYRREFIQNNNFEFPVGLCYEDNVFYTKAFLKSQRCGILQEKLYYRRIHNAAITQNWNKHFNDYIKIIDILLSYIIKNNSNLYSEYKDSYITRVKNIYNDFEETDKKIYSKPLKRLLSKYKDNMSNIKTSQSIWIAWLGFIYYKLRLNSLRAKYVKSSLSALRIDIKNVGIWSNNVRISGDGFYVKQPKWFTDDRGMGRIIEGSKKVNLIKIKAVNNGILKIDFRGQNIQYNDERIPLWIDYKSIKIDGKEILSSPIAAWHDQPYHYETPVKDGQEITLEVEQKYHEYTEDMLKNIIFKMNVNNKEIADNIEKIFKKIKKQFPLIDIETYKKRELAECITVLRGQLTPCRIDIKNVGNANNAVEVIERSNSVTTPKFLTDDKGIGKMMQNCEMFNKMGIKAANDGKLVLTFRGQNKLYNDKRIPVWVDYKSIKIDGKEILSAPIATWHDKPYKYEMPVKDRQEITLEVEQQYHEYSENELKDLLLKLNLNSEYIRDNVELIVSELKNEFPIIDEETQKIKTITNNILENLSSFRLDIKNLGAETNDLKVVASNMSVSEPKWAVDATGRGKLIQGHALKNTIELEAINDGNLRIYFRGQDKRFDEKRFPVWIDYKSIKIDGKEILLAPIATWHDKTFKYEMPVKDGQEITLEVEQQYHEYTEDELRDTLSKLYSDKSQILNQLDEIIKELRKTISVIDKRNYFNLDDNFFVIDSNNLDDVQEKLYGYAIQDNGIIEDENKEYFDKDKISGCGAYVYVAREKGKITISQDFNGSYGLFLFQSGKYFALSNSFFYLVDYLKNKYELKVNTDFANYMLSQELCSETQEDTMVDNIKMLDKDAVVKINSKDKSFTVDTIDYQLGRYIVDSAEGINILDTWFKKWTMIFRNLKSKTNNISISLSGGFDSRLTFLLALKSGINLNDIRVFSIDDTLHTHKEDFEIATEISKHFGVELNKGNYTRDYISFSFEDVINMCIYNRLPFHKEMHCMAKKWKNKCYDIPGSGGESLRSHWDFSADKQTEHYINNLKKYNNINEENIIDSVRKIAGKSYLAVKNKYNVKDINSSDILRYLYIDTRSRNHFGRGAVDDYFCNQYTLAPLLDPDLLKLKINIPECSDNNFLISVIFTRYCPDLLKFKIEGNRKIDEETIARAYEINAKYPVTQNQFANKISGDVFNVITEDKETKHIPNDLNKAVSGAEFEAFLAKILNSEKFRNVCLKYINKDIYTFILDNYKKTSWYPLRNSIPLFCLALVDNSNNSKQDGYQFLLECWKQKIPVVNKNASEDSSAYHHILVVDANEKKKKTLIDSIISDLTSFRLDIKNIGNENNALEVSANNIPVREPSWATDKTGKGKMLQGNMMHSVMQLKAINEGNLKIYFRGQDKRDSNGKRFPLWIDYKSIKIDGTEILSAPIATWHDQSYRYEMPVKDEQEVTLEIEQQYHQYTEKELKELLLKLYSDNEFVKENIYEIIKEVSGIIGKSYSANMIDAYPHINTDCFIPLGAACRPAYWLRKHNLRYCSLPFDLMMSFSLLTVLSTIKSGVSSWFNEYVEDESKIGKKARYVTDTKNKIISMHAFPLEKTVDEYMPEFKELFAHRYKRMKDILETSKSICFICNRNDDVYNFQLFLQEIAKMNPELQIKLLNIRHSDLEQKIIKYEINPNVIFYDIKANDIHANGSDKSNPSFWIGNEDLWNEVCSHLSLSDSVKTKLEEENKDKDSAA